MDRREKYVEGKFDEIMPWIGFYITTASAVCTAAMAADAVRGFRCRKLWFPCKYFSLNALSLTLLAVAMKLTQDVNTNLPSNSHILYAKIASISFISVAMANFMPSLGSMKDKELVANLVALGIIVITFLANMLIEMIQLRRIFIPIIFSPSMLYLFLVLVASAISLPTVKTDLESKYQEKHRVALLADEVVRRRDALRINDKQRREMMKYWVMAETSNPQFVLARSVVCATTVLIHLLISIIFFILLAHPLLRDINSLFRLTSVYGRYTCWILVIQAIGIIVGLIAPTARWFVAVGFKCFPSNQYSFKKELKIENHWIQRLVHYRDTFSPLQIQQHKIRSRYLHSAKWFLLTFCIGIQILIVMFSKLLALVPVLVLRSLCLCVTHTNKFMMWRLFSKVSTSNGNDEYHNLRCYVLLVDGEAQLPTSILKGMCNRADNAIHLGRKKQPVSLIHLLSRFDNFNGVGQFDTFQVPSLHSQEPPNCWTLPIVTLASIAITLPNISNHNKERLMSSVSEGLSLAKIVEKDLNKTAQLVNITKAADVSWVGVALYKKWFDLDLKKTSLTCKNSEEVLLKLSKSAENTVCEFKRAMVDPLLEDHRNWPVNVVASNLMYRISRTILLSFELDNEQTDEGLFERLSFMIAAILAACFTNLAHIIRTTCHHSAIEKREEYVHEAFLLLGKTEQILELLHRHEWPSLDHDKTSYFDEWRNFFSQNQDSPADSTSTSSSNEIVATRVSNEEILVVTVDT